MERLFELSNLLVAPFWLAMILAPRWRVTQWLMRTPLGALAPAFVYMVLVVPRLAEILPVVARPELPAVSAPLVGFVIAGLGLLAASLVLMLVDPRQLGGAPLWLKPAKFAMSTVVAAGTLALLLRLLQPIGQGVRRAAGLIAYLLALELVIITVQAARGVPSHFNASS